MEQLNWGIIGTGNIARKFASELGRSRTGQLVAVGSRSQESADGFVEKFPARAYDSYDTLLQDSEVQAVYISTPHPSHAEWAIRTAEAGKGILCEKPITLNGPQAMAVVEAAHENGVFLMEAFMYRCHPQTERLRELLRDGAIGAVRLISASFSFNAGYHLESRLLKNELGGGGILDVGCYAASMARLIAGEATGRRFAEPSQVQGMAHVGAESRSDEWAVAQCRFEGGDDPIIAQLSTGVRLSTESQVRIYGADGWIEVPSPWMCRPDDGVNIRIHRGGKTLEERVPCESSLYALEADAVADNWEAKAAPPMTPEDSLGNMGLLDAWRKGAGVSYEADGREAKAASNRPLRVRVAESSPATMQYGKVRHLDKKVSRFALGTVIYPTPFPTAHNFALLDDAFERGINVFDTAYIYGTDPILGAWMRSRGVRDQVVILAKGAHTPHCNVESMKRQLEESLERLGVDSVDIYMPHRDNPDIPVEEWMDGFDELRRAGKFQAFGGSNWHLDRVEAANEYARRQGMQEFSAVSNNFSLARMVDPVWDGCIAASDAASRAWLAQHQIANFAWSSQARGFFVRGDESFTDDEELVRCWYAPDNFERLKRAQELAAQKGTTPINVAAAYVLAQPFPQFALIGPRSLEEIRTALTALSVSLSPEECAYLNLERDAV